MTTLLFIPVVLLFFIILFSCNKLDKSKPYAVKDYIND